MSDSPCLLMWLISPLTTHIPTTYHCHLQRKLARDVEITDLRTNNGTKKLTALEKKQLDTEAKAAKTAMEESAKCLQDGIETHFMPGKPDESLPPQSVDGVPVFRGEDMMKADGMGKFSANAMPFQALQGQGQGPEQDDDFGFSGEWCRSVSMSV